MVGGVSANQVTSVLNPQTDTWASRNVIPTRTRDNYAMVPTGQGKVFVLGGTMSDLAAQSLNASSATVEAYDIVADGWTTMIPMPTSRPYLAGGRFCAEPPSPSIGSSSMLVVGGELPSFKQLDTAELFSPDIGAWLTVNAMPTARSRMAVATTAAPTVPGSDCKSGAQQVGAWLHGQSIRTVATSAPGLGSPLPHLH
jgi:hypothetical protein